MAIFCTLNRSDAVFLNWCPDCPSCPASVIQMGLPTWLVWEAKKI